MQPEGALIVSVKDVLFIDANQYLGLYGIPSGKKLLAALQEKRDHIFVTAQVVDEVNRNKVKVTAVFLNIQVQKLEMNSAAVPVHLLSNADGRVAPMVEQLEKTHSMVKEMKEEFKKLTREVLEHVGQSKDEVSRGLDVLFGQAVAPDEKELYRARLRKEVGNPPGKKDNPLGDELSWEQILSHCKEKPRLWIITKDSDYGTVYAGKIVLNAALYRDLSRPLFPRSSGAAEGDQRASCCVQCRQAGGRPHCALQRRRRGLVTDQQDRLLERDRQRQDAADACEHPAIPILSR